MDRKEVEIRDAKALIKYHQSCIDRHKVALGQAHKGLAIARTGKFASYVNYIECLQTGLIKTNEHVIKMMQDVTSLSIRMVNVENSVTPVQ